MTTYQERDRLTLVAIAREERWDTFAMWKWHCQLLHYKPFPILSSFQNFNFHSDSHSSGIQLMFFRKNVSCRATSIYIYDRLSYPPLQRDCFMSVGLNQLIPDCSLNIVVGLKQACDTIRPMRCQEGFLWASRKVPCF